MAAITRPILIVALALVGSSVNAQNLILIGGFESPTIPSSSQLAVVPTSWTGGANTTIVNGNDPGRPLPLAGQQYVAVATSQTLSQLFTVASAGGYTLQWFDSASHEATSSVPYTVNLLSSTSQVVAAANLDAFHVQDWFGRSLNVNLSPGNYTLSFTATGAGGPGGFSPGIDSVSVTAVPEPTTCSLVFAAGLFISGYRTRCLRKWSRRFQ
jgi:hypothetical protein